MSLTFKLLSLAIRTAAKPIGNYIKRQAREHDGFRRFAVSQAQRVHRIDMRMRLGILHDADAQQRMHERELRAAEERKRKAEAPTVRTELEQKKFEEDQAKKGQEGEKEEEKRAEQPRIKIRPLSEAKAIELGANFFSEAFIFAVAAGLIVWDSWRSRKKESARRDDVAERLGDLEAEVDRLRSRYEPQMQALELKSKPEKTYSWYNPAGWWTRSEPVDIEQERNANTIVGNVPLGNVDAGTAIKPTLATKVQKKQTEATAAIATPDKDVQKPQRATRAEPEAKKDDATPQRVDSVIATKKER